jgi:hypothetical protein
MSRMLGKNEMNPKISGVLIWSLIIGFAILAAIGGRILHTYGDMLPPIGHWTNCRYLAEVCDVPNMENNSLSDLAVYRFENGSMIVEYVGDAPIEK